jgi:GNAT superfamily N-acetyltransferase
VSGFVVREALHTDAAALVGLRALMCEAMGTDPALLADPTWRLAAHGWFVDRVEVAHVRAVVAEVDGVVASCAVGEATARIPGPTCPNGSVGVISNVATLQPYRGRGLASACTDHLLGWFAERTDVTRIDLVATEDSARMYARRAFTTSPFPAMRRRVPRG